MQIGENPKVLAKKPGGISRRNRKAESGSCEKKTLQKGQKTRTKHQKQKHDTTHDIIFSGIAPVTVRKVRVLWNGGAFSRFVPPLFVGISKGQRLKSHFKVTAQPGEGGCFCFSHYKRRNSTDSALPNTFGRKITLVSMNRRVVRRQKIEIAKLC